MKIAILSDTHGLLRPEVKEKLQRCDAILHAGDIDRPSVIAEMEQIAPLYVVRGNADKEWAKDLPTTLSVELGGKLFYLIHNKKHITEEADAADFIVYGHSHKYGEKHVGNQIWLNPGSCGKRRFSDPITMMLLEIDDNGCVSICRVDISGEQAVSVPAGSVDLAAVVRKVIKEMDRGTNVKEIAEKCGIEEELAEQICRMYATHPGIDVDGILDRIVKG